MAQHIRQRDCFAHITRRDQSLHDVPKCVGGQGDPPTFCEYDRTEIEVWHDVDTAREKKKAEREKVARARSNATAIPMPIETPCAGNYTLAGGGGQPKHHQPLGWLY
ncbi:MAG: hypothetical protein IPM61_16655 [Chlorobi bacterium]|nr:hypothetical protein [Chlorobiota bacterium]